MYEKQEDVGKEAWHESEAWDKQKDHTTRNRGQSPSWSQTKGDAVASMISFFSSCHGLRYETPYTFCEFRETDRKEIY